MIKKYLLALSLSLMLAPSAFADELVTTDAAAETTVTEVTATTDVAVDPILCGGGCGYWGGVNINVSTVVSAEADQVNLYGSYYITSASSKADAVDELSKAFKDIQAKLSKYGTVRRTAMSTYASWQYTDTFDGSLSIKVTLNDNGQTEGVEELLYKNSFDSWREVLVRDTSAAEISAVSTLKALINSKKGVYEELLGTTLGSVSGVNVYSWPDGSTFNPTTNMVDVTVYADVTYNTQQ